MYTWFRSQLAPPKFVGNDDKTRIARWLNIILLTGAAVAITYSLLSPFIDPKPVQAIAANGVMLALYGSMLILIRRGRVALAGVLFSSLVWLIVTVSLVAYGSVVSPGLLSYFGTIAIAGMLLGGRAALSFAGLTLVATVGVVYAEQANLLPPPVLPSTPPIMGWVAAFNFGVTAITIYLVLRSVTPALASARQELAERLLTEEKLRASEERFRAMIENISDAIVLVDVQGIITYLSPAAERILGFSTAELIGMNTFDRMTQPDDAVRVQHLFGELQAEPQTSKSFELQARHKDGSLHWLEATATNLLDLPSVQAIVVNYHDITERKATEAHQNDFRDRLKVLHEVSFTLTDAETFDDLCRMAVELGHSKLEFDRIGIWLADDDPDYMIGSFGTSETGEVRDERGKRHLLKRERIFVNLTSDGVVWEDTPLFDDQNVMIGRGWLAAATLWDGKRVIGWISIDNFRKQEPFSQQQLDLLILYGMTLGHLCTRKRTEEALRKSEQIAREFQERLRALHEIGLELAAVQSVDDFYYQAVALGTKRLGIERCGLLLLDEDQYLVGTYGTDETGNIRDERHLKIKLRADSPEVQLVKRGVGADYWEDVDLKGDGKVVGHGWNARGVLWNGSKGIGIIATDNYLSQQPPRPYTVDLMGLYANLLGNLLTQKRSEASLRQSEEHAREFQEKLKVLQEISLELVATESIEDLCARAVELGNSALGYDRIGVLVFDDAERTKASKFGIDAIGEVRIERGVSYELENDGVMRSLLADPGFSFVSEDADLRDIDHTSIGRGWNVVVGISDRKTVIGWLAADNLFGKMPLIPYQLELLKLYGLTLGHLYTRKRTEQALRESEERFRAIAEASLMAITISQPPPDLGLLYANPNFFELYGYRPDKISELSMYDLYKNAADREPMLAELRQNGQLKNYDLQGKRADGSPMWLSLTMSPIQFAGEGVLISTILDITERKQAEAALRESEQMFQNVLNNIPTRVFWKDLDYRLLGCNQRFVEDVGAEDAEELIGKTGHDLIKDREPVRLIQAARYRADDRAVIETGVPKMGYEETFLKADGTLRWLRTSKMPLRNAEGEIIGMLGTSEDITERKRQKPKFSS